MVARLKSEHRAKISAVALDLAGQPPSPRPLIISPTSPIDATVFSKSAAAGEGHLQVTSRTPQGGIDLMYTKETEIS
jgi:hypothetical protein